MSTLDFDTEDTQEWLKGLLRGTTAEVTFTKTDGTDRVMLCTLNENIVPKVERDESKPVKTFSNEALRVWDLEKEAWRSFRWNSIKSVNFTL
jgi:hypothetical protein